MIRMGAGPLCILRLTKVSVQSDYLVTCHYQMIILLLLFNDNGHFNDARVI